MKKSTARKLRFCFIGKIIFSTNFTDRLFRKLFVNKFTNKYYLETSLNWKEINRDINQILNKYKGFLGHGTALSIVRDGNIKQNQDLDYDIYEMDNYSNFINDMKQMGYVLIILGTLDNKPIMFTFEKDKSYIDFFVIGWDKQYGFSIKTVSYEKFNKKFKENNDFFCTNKSVIYLRRIRDPQIEVRNINGEKMYLPKKFDEYFIDLYGDNWRIPNKYYNWAINPKKNKPIKIKKCIKHYIKKEYFDRVI